MRVCLVFSISPVAGVGDLARSTPAVAMSALVQLVDVSKRYADTLAFFFVIPSEVEESLIISWRITRISRVK